MSANYVMFSLVKKQTIFFSVTFIGRLNALEKDEKYQLDVTIMIYYHK